MGIALDIKFTLTSRMCTWQHRARRPAGSRYVSGGSRGLGRALTAALTGSGWRVVTDGRDGEIASPAMRGRTARSRRASPRSRVTSPTPVIARASPPPWRRPAASTSLVNNASVLGPSPLPRLARLPAGRPREPCIAVNTFAPLALLQLLLPHLASRGGRVVNISSDAAAEAYEGWGGYGSSKAALDHITAVLAVEHPELRVYAFDPGDMRTDMQQEAFPGEDISDRPTPESVVPAAAAAGARRPAQRAVPRRRRSPGPRHPA